MLGNRAGDSPRRLKILVVAPGIPRPNHGGGDLRITGLLRLMGGRHRVDLFPFYVPEDPEESSRHARLLREAGVRVLPGYWLLSLEYALSRRIYDAVIFEYWTFAELGIDLVARHQPWARIFVDSVEIVFRREEARLSLGLPGYDPGTVADRKRRELAAYRRADAVVTVSDEDGDLLRAEGGIERRSTIPLIVPERPRSPGRRGPELLILGDFSYAPNSDSLLWFVAAIWPTIRRAVPAARLNVIGSKLTDEVKALADVAGVNLLGYVPELAPHLDRAALMVAPLRFGSGVKTKVVEAMMAGLAVVTTSVGAQGLDVTPGEHMVVADGPEEFAGRVIELLDDPERGERIGRAGRSHAASLYSHAAIEIRLEAMFHATIDEGRPTLPPPPWLIRSARVHALRARFALGQIYRAAFARMARSGAARAGARSDVTLDDPASDRRAHRDDSVREPEEANSSIT